jgi:hypothetical protein
VLSKAAWRLWPEHGIERELRTGRDVSSREKL